MMAPADRVASWICCQLGAREHYAVPRALHRRLRLRLMVTDAWSPPGSAVAHLPGKLPRRLAERYHRDLDSAEVRDLTMSLLRHEIEWRLPGRSDWDVLMARNAWFQASAAEVLSTLEVRASERIVVFAHSYSAAKIFQVAKARGWTTVLGQIDPGEQHFAVVRRLADASPQYGAAPPAPPMEYFEQWRRECALADHIVVNSDWSRQALIRAGVDPARLRVVPLAYEGPSGLTPTVRSYPPAFTPERPLRLLFVGTVSVVKGVADLLRAFEMLAGLPVTLTLVGEPSMPLPASVQRLPGLEIVGAVPRSEMARYFQSSDVLIFPSHSDGFGMAQVEAQAAGLPIVASRRCGAVVQHGTTGLLLPEVNAESIAAAVRTLLAKPLLLSDFSRHASQARPAGLSELGTALIKLTK